MGKLVHILAAMESRELTQAAQQASVHNILAAPNGGPQATSQ